MVSIIKIVIRIAIVLIKIVTVVLTVTVFATYVANVPRYDPLTAASLRWTPAYQKEILLFE